MTDLKLTTLPSDAIDQIAMAIQPAVQDSVEFAALFRDRTAQVDARVAQGQLGYNIASLDVDGTNITEYNWGDCSIPNAIDFTTASKVLKYEKTIKGRIDFCDVDELITRLQDIYQDEIMRQVINKFAVKFDEAVYAAADFANVVADQKTVVTDANFDLQNGLGWLDEIKDTLKLDSLGESVNVLVGANKYRNLIYQDKLTEVTFGASDVPLITGRIGLERMGMRLLKGLKYPSKVFMSVPSAVNWCMRFEVDPNVIDNRSAGQETYSILVKMHYGIVQSPRAGARMAYISEV